MADLIQTKSDVSVDLLSPDDSQDPALLFLMEHSTPKSRASIVDCLRRIERAARVDDWKVIPWGKLTNKETSVIRSCLLEQKFPRRMGKPARLAPRTVRMTLSTFRGVLRKAFEIGHMTADEYQRAISWPKLKAYTIPAGRMLEPNEITTLLSFCEREVGTYGSLLRGIFAVLLGAGARREEIAALPVGSLSGRDLRIMGKGRRERSVPLPDSAVQDLNRWIRVRSFLGVTVDTMFVSIDGADRVYNRPISPWGVWSLICTTCDECGIERISTHDFRRTFASELLENNDIATVQRLMGHADASTTAGYDRRGQKAAEKATEGLNKWWGKQ